MVFEWSLNMLDLLGVEFFAFEADLSSWVFFCFDQAFERVVVLGFGWLPGFEGVGVNGDEGLVARSGEFVG